MKIVFENKLSQRPLMSIVLLDWSVRESYHVLDYLNKQTIPREQYEIIWIEYYDRRPKEIESKLREYTSSNKPPILDTWIVMEIPKDIYYHKHLMYNIGIVASKGRIVTFMDSDAVVRPTFVESIIKSFKKDSNIVLHMDQVRNIDKRFYPFNYSSIEEIAAEGCVNLLNGKPRGLVDMSEPLHIVNYGACMSAMRDDLISIGGADDHINYLGHICGPYEMTFRLVNKGKKEIWHPDEWLYHTWHPGQSGDKNFAGPHDGRHMSQTALSARRTGRILPLVENPAIKKLRLKEDVSRNTLLSKAVSEVDLKQWIIDVQEYSQVKHSFGSTAIKKECNKSTISLTIQYRDPLIAIRLYKVSVKIFFKRVNNKRTFIKETLMGFLGLNAKKASLETTALVDNPTIQVNGVKDFIRLGFIFFKYLLDWHKYVVDRCRQCLHDLTNIGVREIAVFGMGDVAEVLCLISRTTPINITSIYDSPVKKKRFMGHKVLPLEEIVNYKGKVIIASFDDVAKRAEMLKEMGVDEKMIVDLW